MAVTIRIPPLIVAGGINPICAIAINIDDCLVTFSDSPLAIRTWLELTAVHVHHLSLNCLELAVLASSSPTLGGNFFRPNMVLLGSCSFNFAEIPLGAVDMGNHYLRRQS